MNKLTTPLVGFGLVILGTAAASAASPAYCALYSREYAKEHSRLSGKILAPEAQQHIQDRAFYKCLNLDEDPALPTASAYSATDDGAPVEADATEPVAEIDATEPPIAEGDAAILDEAPADSPAAAVEAPKKTVVASRGTHRGSGLKAWTPEWKAWCAKHFPRSFDAKTGTVVPYSGKRTLCK